MTLRAGTPAPTSVSISHHRVAIAILIIAALWLVPGAGAGTPASIMLSPDDSSPADSRKNPSPDPAMRAITRAFRTGRAEVLASLLPRGGKAFVSLHTIGHEAGYYGRDQVYFIFQKVFKQYRTVDFSVHRRAEGKQHRKRDDLVYCVGLWSYQVRDARDRRCQIYFSLSLKNSQWSVVQIREAL